MIKISSASSHGSVYEEGYTVEFIAWFVIVINMLVLVQAIGEALMEAWILRKETFHDASVEFVGETKTVVAVTSACLEEQDHQHAEKEIGPNAVPSNRVENVEKTETAAPFEDGQAADIYRNRIVV